MSQRNDHKDSKSPTDRSRPIFIDAFICELFSQKRSQRLVARRHYQGALSHHEPFLIHKNVRKEATNSILLCTFQKS